LYLQHGPSGEHSERYLIISGTISAQCSVFYQAKQYDREGEGLHVGCGKEEEVRKKEAQARKRAEDLRWQEEEASKRLDEEAWRIELDILQKSEEAARKENEVKRKEEEARLKEEAVLAKEEEIQRKEEELAHREEELPADLMISRRSNRRNFASVKKK
jgi:membrane protein involved in colicin uptake